MRQQDGGNHAADVEENLSGQQNAREIHAKLDLLRRKTVKHPAHELGSENLSNHCSDNHHHCHDRDDDGKSLLRVSVTLFGKESRIDGNECNGGRSTGQRDDLARCHV